jgi:hypothetical protein
MQFAPWRPHDRSAAPPPPAIPEETGVRMESGLS